MVRSRFSRFQRSVPPAPREGACFATSENAKAGNGFCFDPVARLSGRAEAFWFTKREDNPRFSKIETIATNAHVHRAKIRNLEELDDSVRRWIDVPSRVGCGEHLR